MGYDKTIYPAPTTSSINTYTFNTVYCNELLLIAYDGMSLNNTMGTGPITVDGKNATLIQSVSESQTNGGKEKVSSQVYGYIAPVAGTHTIIVNENGYSFDSGYAINSITGVYAFSTNNTNFGVAPLTLAEVTSAGVGVPCANSGSDTGSITTTAPNSFVYATACFNDHLPNSQPISWAGFYSYSSSDAHEGDGIEASTMCASTIHTTSAQPYPIIASTPGNSSTPCGGLTLLLVAVAPPANIPLPVLKVDSVLNPDACTSWGGLISVHGSGGIPPYSYEFYPNPNADTGNTATGLSAGTYSISVRDADCNWSIRTVITLDSVHTLYHSAAVITNVHCNGSCNGSVRAIDTGGVRPYTYKWMPGNITTDTAKGLCAGIYTLTITDHYGCSASNTVTITQPGPLTASATSVNAVCFGEPGSLSASATGGNGPYTYTWAPGGGTGAVLSNMPAGAYTVTVKDNNGCNATASVAITEPPKLSVALAGPQVLCKGQTGTIGATTSGGTTPYTYTWSSRPYSTTDTISISMTVPTVTYTVSISDANGCTGSSTITVTMGPPIVLNITGQPWFCTGFSSTICAQTSGGTGGNTYTWGPGNFPGNPQCITVSPATATIYTVLVADNCGYETTAAVTVSNVPSPEVNFHASLMQGCAPLCVQFYNTTLSQGGAAQCVWAFGNGDTSEKQNAGHCYPGPGEYNVSLTVVNDSGCSATLEKQNMITVFAKPEGAFTTSQSTPTILNPTVQFTDQSRDQYDIAYHWWTFGDGSDSTSNASNPIHTYQDTGTYCTNLIIMDAHGCSDTVTNCLIIGPAFTFYIPSAFTPNGDGIDDLFKPVGEYIQNFDMYIFDRWGMLVYHTTDITKGWNGTIHGSGIAQEDSYEYKILITDSDNKQHTYIGIVSLLK